MLSGEVTLTENKSRAKKGYNMLNSTLNLNDITIPEDDKDKPADIEKDINKGDDGVVEELPNADKTTDKKEETTEPEKKDETSDGGETKDTDEKETKTTEDDAKKEPVDDGKKEESKKELSPFHEHEDWKKLQAEKKELELKVARLEGRVDSTTAKDTPVNPYAGMSPAEAASKRIRDEYKDKKFEPKDQLEVTERYEKYKLEFEQQEQEKRNAYKEKISKQIDNTFTELGVTDNKTRDKVMSKVAEWMNEGMAGVSVKTLKVAHDYLKKTGELDEKQETPKTENPPAPAKQETTTTDKKTETNSKISRSGSAGGENKGESKYLVKNARNKSLDTIVLEIGQQMEKPGAG